MSKPIRELKTIRGDEPPVKYRPRERYGTRTKSLEKALIARWYFGGIATMFATIMCHPLQVMKVILQLQPPPRKSWWVLTRQVWRTDGPTGFFHGLTSVVFWQGSTSLTRGGITYSYNPKDEPLPRQQFIALSVFAGMCGGLVGTPSDIVRIRTQNDVRLPHHERRNYGNVFNGYYRIFREEGWRSLIAGWQLTTLRGTVTSLGLLPVYDEIKAGVMDTTGAPDNFQTHLISSIIAGTCSTILMQPMDVLKAHRMNATAVDPKSIASSVVYHFVKIWRSGPINFYRGFGPAWVRITPNTCIIYVTKEFLRLNFGEVVLRQS